MAIDYGIIFGLIAIIIASTSLIISYKQYKSTRSAVASAITHELENLPPYRKKDDETIIKVKNVGTATADILSTYLKFSWDKDLVLDLDWGFEDYEFIELAPNEVEIFRRRLPITSSKGKHTITIVTEFDKDSEKKEEFVFKI